MGPLQRAPGTAPTAFSQDPPWLRRRERSSLVKKRMREICTSGSVRDGDGNAPIYSASERRASPGKLGTSDYFFWHRRRGWMRPCDVVEHREHGVINDRARCLAGLPAVGLAHPNRLPVWTRWHRDRPKPRSRPAAPNTQRCASTLPATSRAAMETRARAIVSLDRAAGSPAAARHRRALATPVSSAA